MSLSLTPKVALFALVAGLAGSMSLGCAEVPEVAGTSGFEATTSTSSGAGDQGGGGAGGGDVGGGFTTSSGTGGDAGLCASAHPQAVSTPVTMFIAMDRSRSMKWYPTPSVKWDLAKGALTAFFQDPANAQTSVAMRFFPDDGCNEGTGDTCDATTCGTPQIDAAELGASQQQALLAALAQATPVSDLHSGARDEGTPLAPSLRGAEAWAIDYAAAHPGEHTVVLLVTDGEPSQGCDQNMSDIAAFAANAQSAGVLTYTVGLEGSSEAQMNQIAQAGGTGKGLFVGAGDDVESLLRGALQASAAPRIACTIALTDLGGAIDPALGTVLYTPSAAGAGAREIAHVGEASRCSANGGFYYDDPASPSSVTLCPATCAAVQADPGAKVDVEVGCALEIPR